MTGKDCRKVVVQKEIYYMINEQVWRNAVVLYGDGRSYRGTHAEPQ